MYVSPFVTTGPRRIAVKRTTFAQYNDARRAAAALLDLVECGFGASPLDWRVDGDAQIVRWQPGAGAL